MRERFNLLACLFVSAKQINPLPYFAMKLIFFGETFEAGITKSPSFSLCSSSTRIYISPFLALRIMFSTELNFFVFIKFFYIF